MKVMYMITTTTKIKQFEELSLQEINLLHNIQLARQYEYVLNKYKSDKIITCLTGY